MPDAIQEFVDSRGQRLRLDQAASVLQGVKLLGLTSRNKRTYPETTLREAIALYEGAKVNVNHPQGDPLGPRDYRDRLGVVRNVELRCGEGLFGSLHFNPRHALAEQLVWDAEHAPENVGLSHNVMANTRRQGEETVVESILHVQSVDLVADPATTDGLFEHQTLCAEASDLPVACTTEMVQSLQQQLAEAERRASVYQALATQGVRPPGSTTQPGEAVLSTQVFEALLTCEESVDLTQLVAEQARLLKHSSPASSREQTPLALDAVQQVSTTEEFVAAVRG